MLSRLLGYTSLTFRQWFALLLTSCILPATLATTLLILDLYHQERAAIETATLYTARALMQTIDRELTSAQGAAYALSTSPSLAQSDLEAFAGQAARLVVLRPGSNLVLWDRSGRQLLNTQARVDMNPPLHDSPKHLRKVFESGHATISDLYIGPTTGRALASVDVPVLQNGSVKYVLSMQIFSEQLGSILAQQKIPKSWIVSVLDGAGTVVARTLNPQLFVGTPASPALLARMAHSAEGSLRHRTFEGAPSVLLFSRSTVSNWTVVIGVLRSAQTDALWRRMSWVAAGALLLFALGLMLARQIGNHIAASVRGLVAPAIALGYGEAPKLPPFHLREADEVGQAMRQAAELMRRRTAERDHAERAERELRDAKREVERSEAFLRGIFEETPDAVFLVAQDGAIVRANDEAGHLFGYAPDSLSGCNIDDLLFDPGHAAAYPVHQLMADTSARGALAQRSALRGRCASGTPFPVDVMVSPLRANQHRLTIATVRDASERERAEQKLRTLNNRLALATRAGGIAVWDFNGATGELVWDEHMYDLYRVPPDSPRGTYDRWRASLHPDDRERAEREALQAIATGKEFATEFRIVWPDGQIRMIRANAVVTFDSNDQATHLTGVNIDITESRQREAAINAALREKETLLKELYHRVKNNLQLITSLFNLQLRTLAPGVARTALTEAASRVRAMALVHEKLYQSGNLSSIALDDYIRDLCAQLGRTASAAAHGIELSAEVAPMEIGLDTAVPVGLLLNELISNSLKHAFPNEHGGRIVVHVGSADDGTIRLSVADNGVGFPPGINQTSSQTLGLKLVAALSEQLGGDLSLENQDGACVAVSFRPGTSVPTPPHAHKEANDA